MERMLFIKQFVAAKPGLDMEHIDMVISQCLDRCHDRFPEYPRGHMNLVAAIEETAEFAESVSRRMRGRTQDNYDILQEMADVIIAIWCVAQIYGISHESMEKAINVKIEQEKDRIVQHAGAGKPGEFGGYMRNQKEIYEYCKEYGIYRTMEKYRMSAAAVRRVVQTWKDRERSLGELSVLRTVTANALRRVGISDKAQLAAFYEKKGEEGLLKLRNIGWTGVKEIKAFLSLENEEQYNKFGDSVKF